MWAVYIMVHPAVVAKVLLSLTFAIMAAQDFHTRGNSGVLFITLLTWRWRVMRTPHSFSDATHREYIGWRRNSS